MENLTAMKDDETGKFGVLVIQERIADADAAKVNVNAKSDAPDTSDSSKIDTTKSDVKIGIVKPCTLEIALS